MVTRKVNVLEGIKVDGKKLAQVRRSIGLSQRKLADLINKHEATIISIETGRRQPSPETLRAICEALNVPQKRITEKVPA